MEQDSERLESRLIDEFSYLGRDGRQHTISAAPPGKLLELRACFKLLAMFLENVKETHLVFRELYLEYEEVRLLIDIILEIHEIDPDTLTLSMLTSLVLYSEDEEKANISYLKLINDLG